MLDWLATHRETVNVLINLGMLLVWVVYLHVFVSNYSRQKRANILITGGVGEGLEARCLVSNLSQSPVYVRCLLLEMRTTAGPCSASVTEIDDLEHWERASDLDLWTRQGPLQPGALRDMGAFRSMLDHALRKGAEGGAGADLDSVEGFDLTVICDYGPENLIVAAGRSYTIDRSGGRVRLRPHAISPRQIRSRRERARLKALLERDLF